MKQVSVAICAVNEPGRVAANRAGGSSVPMAWKMAFHTREARELCMVLSNPLWQRNVDQPLCLETLLCPKRVLGESRWQEVGIRAVHK